MEILYFSLLHGIPLIFKFIFAIAFNLILFKAFANLEQGRTATPSVSETISEV